MADQPAGVVHCASYTHARRHPMVLGRIAGWTPPFQLSLVQIGVLLVSFFVMVQTWRLWAEPLPNSLALVVGAGVPIALTWAVRRVRIEGRSLPRAAVGWVTLWCTPHRGTLRGRPFRDPPAVALGWVRMNVAGEPPERADAAEPPERAERAGAGEPAGRTAALAAVGLAADAGPAAGAADQAGPS